MHKCHVGEEGNADEVHVDAAVAGADGGDLDAHPVAVFDPANTLRLDSQVHTGDEFASHTEPAHPPVPERSAHSSSLRLENDRLTERRQSPGKIRRGNPRPMRRLSRHVIRREPRSDENVS